MIAMKNSKDILNNAIEEVSEKELMEVAGGKRYRLVCNYY